MSRLRRWLNPWAACRVAIAERDRARAIAAALEAELAEVRS